ncbi:MAG TPA: hypothetical protein VFI65_04965 [Streptosporangiaceae bacterium]|nr:hypothetical protein [Streptosporangiaceae bacterium]
MAIGIAAISGLFAGVTASPADAAGAGSGSQRSVAAHAHVFDPAADPDFTCPSRTICMWPHNDGTGTYGGGQPAEIYPPSIPSDQWFRFDMVGADSPYPGMVQNNSGSSIWMYDAQEPVTINNPHCLQGGGFSLSTMHSYGHFEVIYGDPSCNNSYSRPLP